MKSSNIIPIGLIEKKIYLIRNQKVILDEDSAELYGVATKQLNQQAKRNLDRFPDDFIFQLTRIEFNSLRSHFVTSKGKGEEDIYPLHSQSRA